MPYWKIWMIRPVQKVPQATALHHAICQLCASRGCVSAPCSAQLQCIIHMLTVSFALAVLTNQNTSVRAIFLFCCPCLISFKSVKERQRVIYGRICLIELYRQQSLILIAFKSWLLSFLFFSFFLSVALSIKVQLSKQTGLQSFDNRNPTSLAFLADSVKSVFK